MKLADRRKRRRFLARMFGATAATTLAGCNQLSLTSWAPKVLDSAEKLSQGAANLFARKAMAQEFSPADLSPTFRSNGTREPNSDAYRQLAGGGFAAYRLQVLACPWVVLLRNDSTRNSWIVRSWPRSRFDPGSRSQSVSRRSRG